MDFAWTIVALVVLLAVAWRFLGSYMAAVFQGRVRWLSFIERPIYRITGVDPESEQTWRRYAVSVILFSGVALLVTYLIFRLQGVLPFNPQHLRGISPALAWNTGPASLDPWAPFIAAVTRTKPARMKGDRGLPDRRLIATTWAERTELVSTAGVNGVLPIFSGGIISLPHPSESNQ